MPRTFPRLTTSIALLACAFSGAALAQTPAAGQPPTERIEPGSDVPATRIEPKRGPQIREKRNNSGQVTEVEVQSGKSHYVMKSGQPVGNAQPDAQSSGIRAPQWQVLEFDLNGKRKAAADAAAAAAAADASPAAPAPAKSASASARDVPAATAPMLKPADIPPPPPMPATR